MTGEDWDYLEWPYQLRVRAKTREELIEQVELLLDGIKTGKADIVVGFHKDLVLGMVKPQALKNKKE